MSKPTNNLTPGILSHWRDALGLSQAAMAALIGAPLPTFIKWEKGYRKPPTIALNAIVLLHWLEQSHPAVFQQIRNARLRGIENQANEKRGK